MYDFVQVSHLIQIPPALLLSGMYTTFTTALVNWVITTLTKSREDFIMTLLTDHALQLRHLNNPFSVRNKFRLQARQWKPDLRR